MELSKTITLEIPITSEGVSYSELTMRRPKTKDALAAAKIQAQISEDRTVFLLARLCDVGTNVIEELFENDTNKLIEQLNVFRGRQPD